MCRSTISNVIWTPSGSMVWSYRCTSTQNSSRSREPAAAHSLCALPTLTLCPAHTSSMCCPGRLLLIAAQLLTEVQHLTASPSPLNFTWSLSGHCSRSHFSHGRSLAVVACRCFSVPLAATHWLSLLLSVLLLALAGTDSRVAIHRRRAVKRLALQTLHACGACTHAIRRPFIHAHRTSLHAVVLTRRRCSAEGCRELSIESEWCR